MSDTDVPTTDLPEAPHDFYPNVGIVIASACTSLTDDQAATRMNSVAPTGVGPWTVDDDPRPFNDGTVPGSACPDFAHHRHIRFTC